MRSLALDFAISLESPTSRRLFRLLELLRHADKPPRRTITLGLWKLRDRLGMSPYRYPSKIREKLAPAIEEMVSRGYLEGMDIEATKDGEPIAIFRFGDPLSPVRGQSDDGAPKTPGMALNGPLTEPAGTLRQILLPDFGPRQLAALDFDNEDEQNLALDLVFSELDSDEKTPSKSACASRWRPFCVTIPARLGRAAK